MDEQIAFYRHSGRFSVSGWTCTLATTLLATSLLAWIYTYAILYIPLVYISVLLTFGFGLSAGMVAGLLAVRFKIRNSGAACLATFLALLFGYYLSWAIWLAHHLRETSRHPSFADLLVRPRATWQLIQAISKIGTWSIGHGSSSAGAVSDGLLWAIWIAEVLIIFGTALQVVRRSLGTPFCEDCNQWCVEHEGLLVVSGARVDDVRGRLVNREWSMLGQVADQEPALGTWGRLDLCTCPSCAQTNTLSLKKITRTQDKKGKTETKEKLALDRMLLSQQEAESLLAICQSLNPKSTIPSEEPAETADAPATPS